MTLLKNINKWMGISPLNDKASYQQTSRNLEPPDIGV